MGWMLLERLRLTVGQKANFLGQVVVQAAKAVRMDLLQHCSGYCCWNRTDWHRSGLQKDSLPERCWCLQQLRRDLSCCSFRSVLQRGSVSGQAGRFGQKRYLAHLVVKVDQRRYLVHLAAKVDRTHCLEHSVVMAGQTPVCQTHWALHPMPTVVQKLKAAVMAAQKPMVEKVVRMLERFALAAMVVRKLKAAMAGQRLYRFVQAELVAQMMALRTRLVSRLRSKAVRRHSHLLVRRLQRETRCCCCCWIRKGWTAIQYRR